MVDFTHRVFYECATHVGLGEIVFCVAIGSNMIKNRLSMIRGNLHAAVCKCPYFVFPAFIGAAIFLLVYGFVPLDVTYDHWILNGYVENDIVQHYAGWVNFRNSDWAFPLGNANLLMYPIGEVISFTDSIPIVSIFFKSIRFMLPETFQFFGIYVFLCFVLQGISSAMLVHEFTDSKVKIALSSAVFCLSPIMMERAFRHTALASHFLILFALYLYFHARNNGHKFQFGYIILHVLAIGIHPYFLPIIFGIMCAHLLDMLIAGSNRIKLLGKILGFITINIAATAAFGYIIGAIGGESEFAAEGYGYYCMNLNAIINPYSLGGYNWSRFTKVHGQTLGNFDGFNYLGFGVIIFLFAVMVACIFRIRKCKNWIKRNVGIIVACIIFTLFAISNVVTLNGKILFDISLPKKLYGLFSIFRSGGRMFYPVNYLLVLFVIKSLVDGKLIRLKYHAQVLLAVLFAIQLIDLSSVMYYKHKEFDKDVIEEAYEHNILNNEQLYRLGKEHKYIKFLDYEAAIVRQMAVFVGQHELEGANITIGSRKTDYNIYDEIYLALLDVVEGKIDDDTIYVVADYEIVEAIMPKFTEDFKVYEADNLYVIARCP